MEEVPKQKKSWWARLPRWGRGLLIIGALFVVAGLVFGALWLYRQMSAPIEISRAETTNALSSRISNAEEKRVFAHEEPIMLYFDYTEVAVGTALKIEVMNRGTGEVVRSSATTSLCEEEGCQQSGRRHVSIVSTGGTILPAGRYRITLTATSPSDRSGRVVRDLEFAIE